MFGFASRAQDAQDAPPRDAQPRQPRSGADNKPAAKAQPAGRPKASEQKGAETRGAEPRPAAAPAAAAQPSAITAKLTEAGAGTCAGQLDALAGSVMGGVAQFNTVSSWASGSPDRRAVSVSIGQSYGPGKPVPYGATTLFAVPNGQGGCDGASVQVVPSPLPCDRLRETLSASNRQVGDLAGVPLMQDAAGGQTLLVATAGNACVLVGLRTAYAK